MTVFAASSLTNPLTEVGEQYDAENGTETRFSFASSSALARQVAYGPCRHLYQCKSDMDGLPRRSESCLH
ncbi:substrate-binding domain-containing protein [Veronia nyctiphanis]|uniref:substrate-binding domain-containing protein n=1 Tax=Veronia nyctiphanis TaxID=1278244 RepID=UPI002E2748D6